MTTILSDKNIVYALESTLMVSYDSDDRYYEVQTGLIRDGINTIKLVSSTMDIKTAFRFSGTKIEQGYYINSANLSMYIINNDFDSEFTVTIRGYKTALLTSRFTSDSPFSFPVTTASYNIDVSELGTGWVNVSIRSIIHELVSMSSWNIIGTSGFGIQILAVSGNGEQLVIGTKEGGYAPRLYVDYTVYPTDAFADGVYWKTVNGYDIYNYTHYDYENFYNDYTQINTDVYLTTTELEP